MSKFDFDVFNGDYPLAVSKERYTEEEAIAIAKHELGVDEVEIHSGFVRYGFGVDADDPCATPYNNWWLHLGTECPKGCCPVWVCSCRCTSC